MVAICLTPPLKSHSHLPDKKADLQAVALGGYAVESQVCLKMPGHDYHPPNGSNRSIGKFLIE